MRSSSVTEVAAGQVSTSHAGSHSVPWHEVDGIDLPGSREQGIPQGPCHQRGNTAWGAAQGHRKGPSKTQNDFAEMMALGWHVQDHRADRTKNDTL